MGGDDPTGFPSFLYRQTQLPTLRKTGNGCGQSAVKICGWGAKAGWLSLLVDTKKVKVAHTRLPAWGSGADPGSWQSALHVT